MPPPYHGVTVSTDLVLRNRALRERFDVEHVDTSDHRTGSNLGRWDVTNVSLGIRAAASLARRLGGPRGVVYLPLSQNAAAFLRDSLLVHLAATAGWRLAGHLRGSDFPTFYAAQSAPLRAWIRQTLGRLDSIGVMGSALRGVFDGIYPRERIDVVPNGTPDVPDARSDGRSAANVLFLSNLRRRKGVVEAVDAARLVLERVPEARFTFVGAWEDDRLERALLERARPYGERIAFLPPATGAAKDDLLASATLLLFPPAQPEGHPRVVLEALAAGLPVVTTDRGAIAETVVDGESGYVLPDPDAEQLAERVTRLLVDGELRQRMARAARGRYLDRFTQEQADRRLADWLEDVAQRSR